MPASLAVTVTPHWFNGWFLRMFAVAVVRIDGDVREVAWDHLAQFDIEPGTHTVSAGARYRGSRGVLGVAPADVHVAAGHHLHLLARNGPLNHQPFIVRQESTGRQDR